MGLFQLKKKQKKIYTVLIFLEGQKAFSTSVDFVVKKRALVAHFDCHVASWST